MRLDEIKQLDLGLTGGGDTPPEGKGSFEKFVKTKQGPVIKFKGYGGVFGPEGTPRIHDYYIAMKGHPKYGTAGMCRIYKISKSGKVLLHVETREHFGKYWIEPEYLEHPLRGE